MEISRAKRWLFGLSAAILLMLLGTLGVRAEDEITLPSEFDGFIGSVESEVIDKLPEDALSGDTDNIGKAALELASPKALINALVQAFGEGLRDVLPRLATVVAIVMLSALCYAFSSNCGAGLCRAVELCTRLCSFCATATVALYCVGSLKEYFEGLFRAVAAFIPLSATLYAMGGNVTQAASSSLGLGAVLSVCQFLCSYTVIPVFCLCLCSSLISVFDGAGSTLGIKAGATLRKWYMTAMAFVMMTLTGAVTAQSIISAKADTAAMKGAKLAVSQFVPLFGGTLSGTLGTLASSVELLRGSVGIIGIAIIILMLLPTAVELALMRLVFSVGSFCAGLAGCSSEQRIMSDIGDLYGYLEGTALICSAVFIIAFGIFAASTTPFS